MVRTFLRNYILVQKHEPIFINKKSLNQYPNLKAKTSDEIQPLGNYEISSVFFDDMLLSKQTSDIDLSFTRRHHNIIDIFSRSQSYFPFPRNTVRKNSNIVTLFEQNIRDIILS